MRAIAQARRGDAADDASTPETPPHFARSGWTTAIARDAISASKASAPIMFSPAASGIVARRGEALPLLPGPVGAQRLLEPAGPSSARRRPIAIAASRSQAWLASTITAAPAPAAARTAARFSRSRASPKPTFSLNAVWPASRSAATVSPGRSGLMPLA